MERQEKRVKRFGKNADSDGMILTEEAVEKLYKRYQLLMRKYLNIDMIV